MNAIDKGPRIGKRHVQILMMFSLLTIGYGMRVQLSVALVAMTEKNTSPNPDVPVFDWDNTSVILSSFYWGYLWLQVLAGNLGRVYGTKYFLLVSMTCNAIICCTIPIIVETWSSYGLMAIRALQGLSQGFFYPSINDVLSKWSPTSERSTLGNLAYSGAHFGTIITMPLVASISATWYGWPLSFYVYGSMGLLWSIVFYFVGASSPGSHPSISMAEKDYIESNLDTEKQKSKIPWKAMIFNGPFFAVYFAQIGQYFSALVLLLETPTYLNKVMKFDIESNGFLSATPAVASFVSIIFFGYIGDYVINRNLLPIIWSRKLFTTIGSVIPAAAVLVLGFCPEDAVVLSVAMLILAAGSAAACGAGSQINHIDLSPNFAGVLLGIINSTGTFVSIFGPIAVQFIVKDEVFDWDNTSVILSSFYWGYFWLQVLAGNLGRVHGTKYFLLVSMICNAIICCTIPIIVETWSSYGLMAIRALQGLSQGFFFPSINDVLSKWSPTSERSTLGNLAYSGAHFGTIITMPLVASISASWYGWPLSFYVYGSIGLLWSIAFYFIGASSPGTHPSISMAEKDYIESHLDTEKQKSKIPWKAILFNGPFFAVYIAQIGQYFSSLVLLLETPTYLNKVMKFDIQSNGFLSATPAMASFVSIIFFGYIGDYVINRNLLPIIWSRKLFTTIGSVIPAAAVLVLGFCSEDAVVLSVTMLILASGSAAACGAGSQINHIDLSPNFAGVLMGIINSSGTFVSIFGPLAVQFIVKDETDKNYWRTIFIITAAVFIIPWILFSFLASAEVQPFDASKESIEQKKKRLKKHSVISVMSRF